MTTAMFTGPRLHFRDGIMEGMYSAEGKEF